MKSKALAALLGFILVAAPGAMAQEQLTRGYGLDRIVEITPDSPMYGVDVAIDNAFVDEGQIVHERASEMKKMQEENKTEALEKAQQDMERVTERIRNREQINNRTKTGLENAEMVLEQVRENAPEEAQVGLDTALENVRNAKNKPVEAGPENIGKPESAGRP